MKPYYVYIMASWSRVLYVGMTTDLERRVSEHRQGLLQGFTSRYRVTRLVYYEALEQFVHALERERQIKGWRRERKLALIESANPAWDDLAVEWFRE